MLTRPYAKKMSNVERKVEMRMRSQMTKS